MIYNNIFLWPSDLFRLPREMPLRLSHRGQNSAFYLNKFVLRVCKFKFIIPEASFKDDDMKKQWICLFMCLACGFLTGCTEKQMAAPDPKCLSGVDINSAMKSSEMVLVGMNFVIDKQDTTLHIMTTKPQAGSQFFELWRKDNVGGYNMAQSNLHSIQRTVELGFNEIQGQVCIVCTVKRERLSIPEKQLDSAGKAYSLYTTGDQTMQNMTLNAEQEKMMDWIDIGRDSRLEKVILDKIDKKITGKKKGGK
jgi:hypothetical protein